MRQSGVKIRHRDGKKSIFHICYLSSSSSSGWMKPMGLRGFVSNGLAWSSASAVLIASSCLHRWQYRYLEHQIASQVSPCSVKAWGRNFVYLPLPTSKIPIWNLRESHSSFVNWNIKSDGKRLINVMCQKAPTSLFLICFPCLNRFSYLCYRCRRRA